MSGYLTIEQRAFVEDRLLKDFGHISIIDAVKLLDHAKAVDIELARLQAIERRWLAMIQLVDAGWNIEKRDGMYRIWDQLWHRWTAVATLEDAVDAAIERLKEKT